jgi:hypothetical protein
MLLFLRGPGALKRRQGVQSFACVKFAPATGCQKFCAPNAGATQTGVVFEEAAERKEWGKTLLQVLCGEAGFIVVVGVHAIFVGVSCFGFVGVSCFVRWLLLKKQ